MKIIRKKKEDGASPDRKPKVKLPAWKVLIVDDEPDIHTITRLNLKNFEFAEKGLQFLQAMSAREAKEILATNTDIALALIDVVMETDDAGLKLVEYIRSDLKNTLMRLIVRTGQPGVAPERIVVDRYDIDDYKDKTELTAQKLYTTVRSALKAFRDLSVINANRRGLEKILDSAPNLHRPQSLNNFFDGILTQIIGLCNLGENSLLATIESGLVVTASEERISIQAGTGRFANFNENPEINELLRVCAESILQGKPSDILPAEIYPIALKVNDETKGFVCLENAHHLSASDKRLIHIMANQCASALKNLELFIDLKEANHQALYMLAVAAEYKDKDTGDHINRLAHYTQQMAKALDFSDEEAEHYGEASMLHDIGKVGIPDEILKKPGKLTAEEFDVIKTHPQLGSDILCKNKWFSTACQIAYAHHEKWDGSGYPRGLKAEAIPLPARIVAIADVFDALINKRAYKDPWPVEKALSLLEAEAGKHFDPKLVAVFIRLYHEGVL